jgi:hypothetical protein
MEKLFPGDILSKRERVERCLRHEALDRAPLHDQLSYSPAVAAHFTGRRIVGFQYDLRDIGAAVRQSLDMAFPIVAPRGQERYTDADGFVYQNDEWTSWRVSKPFDDVAGAREWLLRTTERIAKAPLDPQQERERYRSYMLGQQALVGETVLLDYSHSATGFCTGYSTMGLELFAYLYDDEPGIFHQYMEIACARAVRMAQAVADPALTPAVLIPEDFATKQGPIFSPEFLAREHFPYVKRVAEAWHAAGLLVIYHSDGNWRKVIPQLIECGVDGFYCLEPAVGMDIVQLKRDWPQMVWAGGVDGVDLMERGTPEQVRRETLRHIDETDVLQHGGMFVASSSEINPTIPAANYLAMVAAVGERFNADFRL